MNRESHSSPRAPADVGVLFVHGIGEQKRADTLVQFGEALKRWLKRWLSEDTRGKVSVLVRHASLNPESDLTPAHAEMHILAPGVDSKWLLAECWWAASFQAPKYSDLWKWAVQIVPLAVADHFLRRLRLARSRSRKTFELATAGIAMALLPILLLTVTISLVVGILPIPRLRTALVRLQKLLIGTVGDSYTRLESSIRGAAMSSRVQQDLLWIKQAARKTVIVAHSQGAAVAHAALRPLDEPKPDLLFTFGSGLRKLLLLETVPGHSRLMVWLLSVGLLLISWYSRQYGRGGSTSKPACSFNGLTIGCARARS